MSSVDRGDEVPSALPSKEEPPVERIQDRSVVPGSTAVEVWYTQFNVMTTWEGAALANMDQYC